MIKNHVIVAILMGIGVGSIASYTAAYELLGQPPLPEVTGIPSYVAAERVGAELVRVTNETTGQTVAYQILKNSDAATYTVQLVEGREVVSDTNQ